MNIADIRRQQEAYASAAFYTQLQLALQFLGFYTGPINGINTPETQAALAAFQTSVGLPPTGVWDEATAAAMATALGEYAALLTQTTRDIQQLMTDLGYYTGPIDGIWNQELTDAIKALQRDLGVPETGVLDAATLQAIYALGPRHGRDDHHDGTAATTVPPTTAPPVDRTADHGTSRDRPSCDHGTRPRHRRSTAPPTTVPPLDPRRRRSARSCRPPEYSDYLSLLMAAGFQEDFDQPRQYTVFAPDQRCLHGGGLRRRRDILADVEGNADKVAELNLAAPQHDRRRELWLSRTSRTRRRC